MDREDAQDREFQALRKADVETLIGTHAGRLVKGTEGSRRRLLPSTSRRRP